MRSTNRRKTALLVMAVMLGSAATQAAAAPPVPAAQPFDAVGKPDSIDPQWRAALCAHLPQPCDASSLRLLRPRAPAADAYVVLSDQPLAMARVTRTPRAGWKLDALHDFGGYRHSMAETTTDNGTAGPQPLSLAPALYPVADGHWAVAVLWSVTESYSGGGASFRTADFVPLDGPKKADGLAHSGVPFACYKMVRACFSEKEYKTSPHCHDESTGSLRIAYAAPAKAGGDYRWSYTWRQSEWAAHEPARNQSIKVARFTDRGGQAVPFCGGPQ
jgi:hypothetical protein